MFSIHETGDAKDRERVAFRRLCSLRLAREAGYFDEKSTEPMPEIVADGQGPDDRGRPSPFVQNQAPPEHGERCPHAGGNVAAPVPTVKYHTALSCKSCDGYTRHVSYGRGSPTWHCVVCCACDLCIAQLEGQLSRHRAPDAEDLNRARTQIARAQEKLYETAIGPAENYFFCTKCGAALRCSTCMGDGTGSYCELCGEKLGAEGFCTDCWEEKETD